jgi:hypothetical protein
MKGLLILTLLLLPAFLVKAQPDTLPKSPITAEIWDVVAIYKEHTDSRGVTRKFTHELKGEILNYDASTGLITFKDQDGKMYALKAGDYKYFEYDKQFTVKNKQVVLRPRKSTGFDYSVGINMGYFNINQDFTPDEFYLNGFSSTADIPVSLRLGASRFLNAKSTVGLSAEYALLMGDSRYFSLGARFQYLYNTEKNASFYFPVAVNYSNYRFGSQYQINDTLFTDPTSWQYPASTDMDASVSAVELNIGQGISFALKNKHAFNVELLLMKQFVINQTFTTEETTDPKTAFGISGLKLGLSYNF